MVRIVAELAGLVQEFGWWSWCYGQGRTMTSLRVAEELVFDTLDHQGQICCSDAHRQGGDLAPITQQQDLWPSAKALPSPVQQPRYHHSGSSQLLPHPHKAYQHLIPLHLQSHQSWQD
jgi:hypothetical protein